MNYKMILYVIGYIMKLEAGFMLVPMIISAFGKEGAAVSFIITMVLLLAIGFSISFKKPSNTSIQAKEGLVIVALAWIVMSIFGALPFTISGYIPSFIDSFFEVVSGFTTTGATILTDVEVLPNSLVFWRSFTHWIGGMGVLVFVLAILPLSGGKSMHIMRAEAPGPIIGKLVPKLKYTASILYSIYIFLTVLLIILLFAGGMPLFDSFIHAFGTAGTGGFSDKNLSIGFYNSAYIDGIITTFMLLFGINFNLYYLLLLKDFKKVFKNEELRWYLGIVFVSIILIVVNIFPMYNNVLEALRYSSFQVASIITTTGYATADFNMWPEFSKSLLVFLMFLGANAGSTGGGIKTSRFIILIKAGFREIKRIVYPRHIDNVKLDNKIIEREIVSEVTTYFGIYIMIILFSTLLISIDGLGYITNTTAVISCINNIGPGLDVVGPVGNYSAFSPVSKLVLSFDMLAGRLEIFPMLVIFYPSVWKKFS